MVLQYLVERFQTMDLGNSVKQFKDVKYLLSYVLCHLIGSSWTSTWGFKSYLSNEWVWGVHATDHIWTKCWLDAGMITNQYLPQCVRSPGQMWAYRSKHASKVPSLSVGECVFPYWWVKHATDFTWFKLASIKILNVLLQWRFLIP